MSTERNKAVLAHYLSEVWGTGDIDAIREFLAPGFKRYRSPTLPALDTEGQTARLKGLQEAFPDVVITIERIAAEGELVAIQGTLSGTHLGDFAGIPATGRRVEVGLVDMIRFEEGRFAEHWGGPDMADLMRQIEQD